MRKLVFGLVCLLFLTACRSEVPNALLAQADSEYELGNYIKAESLYESYLKSNPQGGGRWDAWRRLVDISLNVTGNDKKAASILEAAYLEFADHPEYAGKILSRLAQVQTSIENYEKAVTTWRRLLELHPPGKDELWEVHWNLGKLYQFQGRYDMAREAMLACIEYAPNDAIRAKGMYELAQAYSLLKNRPQARVWLKRVLEANGAEEETKALAAYLLSEIYELEGDFQRARELLQSIRDTYPNPLVIDSRLKHLAQ